MMRQNQPNLRNYFLVPVLFALFFWAAQPLAAQKMATADLRTDLTFLQKVVYKGHQGVFLFNTKDSLDRFFDDLSSHLRGDSVPIEQAMVSVMLATARIRDGHTSVETPFFTDKTIVLPFTFQIVGDKAYVLGNYSGDTSLRRGIELKTINGNSAETVIRLGRLLHSGDGYNTSFTQSITSVYFGRHYSLLFGTRPMNTVTAVQVDEKITEHRVPGISRADFIKLLTVKAKRPPADPPVLKYRDMELRRDTAIKDLAILKLGSFPNGRYERFYRRVFGWLAEQEMRTLVLDLRYNTGGNVHNMGHLCAHILDQDLRYQYERQRRTRIARYFNMRGKINFGLIWLKYNSSFGLRHKRAANTTIRIRRVKPQKKHNFNGKLLVLTNGWSFSSASMATSFLKNRGNAIVIGTESGGNEAGNCGGGYPKLTLPKSGFKIRFPLYHLRYDIGKKDIGRGVQPDYPTSYSIEAILSGSDLEMEQVYRLMGRK
jgi:hypothetical protein